MAIIITNNHQRLMSFLTRKLSMLTDRELIINYEVNVRRVCRGIFWKHWLSRLSNQCIDASIDTHGEVAADMLQNEAQLYRDMSENLDGLYDFINNGGLEGTPFFECYDELKRRGMKAYAIACLSKHADDAMSEYGDIVLGAIKNLE